MLGAEDVKKIEIESPVSTTDTALPESPKPQTTIIPGETAKLKLAEMFNINLPDIGKYEHDMHRILDYVNQFDPKTMDDVVYYIKSLGARLGSSNLENQIKTISRYIFLNNQKSQIEKDMERMTRNG